MIENGNHNHNPSSFNLSWQNVVMTMILLLSIGGAFWALAYNPIQTNISELKGEVASLRSRLEAGDEKTRQSLADHIRHDNAEFLTKNEHNEFKLRTDKSIDEIKTDIKDMKREVEERRKEVATKTETQQNLLNTKAEFSAEIKRLDQQQDDSMKRKEFEIWQREREKTIQAIQDRQKAFSEALDSLYSRVTAIITQTTQPQK